MTRLLLTSVSVGVLSLIFGNETAYAAATVCPNGGAATIDVGNCTVQTGTIPTTVSFVAGTNGSLVLDGAAPYGAVTTVNDGFGLVSVDANSSSNNSFGAANNRLFYLGVGNDVTFNLAHDVNSLAVALGYVNYNGSNAVINQSAGTVTGSTLYLWAAVFLVTIEWGV